MTIRDRATCARRTFASGIMFASGVCGDTTAVLSEAVSFDEGTDTLERFCLPC
jgi:hypothetical protein